MSTLNVNTIIPVKIKDPTGFSGSSNYVLTADGTGSWSWSVPITTPAGTIIFHSASTAPSGYIKANGAAVSRTTYADLFAAIGTIFGVGDGSTTFNVPDMRGQFPRGWVDNGSVDSGRTFGSSQADDFASHQHPFTDNFYPQTPTNHSDVYIVNLGTNGWAAGNRWSITAANTTNPVGGTETRPKNIALLACIKY